MYIPNDREYLDYHRVLCGLPRLGAPGPTAYRYEMLTRTEWSPEFEQLMRNRLVMGALRYGLINDKRKPAWNKPLRIVLEIAAYLRDFNKERLVDIANMCLLMFVEDGGTFEPKDDCNHTEKLK